jgi:hypothetical protein
MTRETRRTSTPTPTATALAGTDSGAPDSGRVRVVSYAAAAIVTLVLLALVGVMSGWPLMWAGDNYTDANVLMAGENFAKLGFWKLHFLPVHYIAPSADCPVYYYLHYPPLDQWVNGLLQSLGVHSVYVMRLICGILFIAGLLAMYWAFLPLIGPLAAVCGLALAGTSGFFIGYATSLHHSYNVFFLGLFLLFFLAYTRSERPAARRWWGAWIALVLASLVSYEFILYTQVFAWVYLIGTGQVRRHGKAVLLLATAPLLGVGLHFLQNCWAIGLTATLTDGFGYGAYTEKGRWYWLRQLPLSIVSRSSQRYFWPLPALLLAAVLVSRLERPGPKAPSRRPVAALFLAAFLASLGWYLFMARHAVIHPHTAGQLLPLVFAVLGCVTAWVLRGLFEPGQTRSTRVLAGLVLLILIGGQYQAIVWRMEEWKSTVVEFIEALGPDALPPKTAVLHNTTTPHFAYFMRHPGWRSLVGDGIFPLPQCIPEVQRHLPPDWKLQYYVFFGTGDRDTFRLLASACPGRRIALMPGFPIILFDISELHRPEAERTPLDAETRERQLRGVFPEWQVRGFAERLERALAAFPTPNPD